jgi:hypothetical protein
MQLAGLLCRLSSLSFRPNPRKDYPSWVQEYSWLSLEVRIMHEFVQELGLFLWAVIAHWQSYVTGGLVTAAVTIYERKSGKSLPWKWYVALFLVSGGLVAFFYAWHDEHRNAQVLIDQKAEVWSKYAECNSDNRQQKADARSMNQQLTDKQNRIESQQGIIDSQLGTVTSCIATLTKASVQESLRIINRGVTINDSKQGTRPTIILVAETNKPVSGFVGKIKCDAPFAIIQAAMISGIVHHVPAFNTQPGELHTELVLNFGANWNPHDPIIALVQGVGLRAPGCSISSD